MPPSDIQPDPPADRRLYLAFTLLAISLFAAALTCYFVPASRGGDKNGYLLGGKAMLSHPLRGMRSPDEYAYLGRYWIRLPSGRYGLKFSPGLPALDAVVMGIARGSATAGHAVTPVCAVLALLGAFFLFRDLAGSFAAFLGVAILASNSTVVVLANTPTSHAPALCTVTWGLYLLLRWWRGGIIATAIGAGLLLGYSATIRYTEVLLLMPMAAAIFTRQHAGATKRRHAEALLGSWFLPIAAILAYNLAVFHYLTGYSNTNESTAFAFRFFKTNAIVLLTELIQQGWFLIFPLAVVGLIVMAVTSRRLAIVLLAWILPALALYSAYYWAPEGSWVGYLRFVLTLFPAFIAAAMWCIGQSRRRWAKYHLPLTLAAGVMTAITVFLGARKAVAAAELDQRNNLITQMAGDVVRQNVPAGSVVFSDPTILNHLQLIGDWRLYQADMFTPGFVQRLAKIDPQAPQALQPLRAARLLALLGNLDAAGLARQQNALIDRALVEKHRVFAALPEDGVHPFEQRYLAGRSYSVRLVTRWSDDARLLEVWDNRWSNIPDPAAEFTATPRWRGMVLIEIWRPAVSSVP